MEKICVVGAGYVGLTTSACFAELGNYVQVVDVDEQRVLQLKRGKLPVFEPGLDELVRKNVHRGRLTFTTSYSEAAPSSDFIFIAVNTPEGEQGEADMSYVRNATAAIGCYLRGRKIIVNKSTMPVGSGDMVTRILQQVAPEADYAVVSNPEFLREGSALQDFMHPDRVVLGSKDLAAARRVAELYRPLLKNWTAVGDLPPNVVLTNLRTAEMIKYASNAFLATRISFMNEMARICDELKGFIT